MSQDDASGGAHVADKPPLTDPADEPPEHADGAPLATRLAEAHRRVAELDLPAPESARLHRQFIAVCDAVKAAGADEVAAERRITAFMSALERAEQGCDPRI
jgi:hypothetical protein